MVPGHVALRANAKPASSIHTDSEQPANAPEDTTPNRKLAIKSIYGITVPASDPDGTPLAERVEVTHFCTGDAALTFTFGTPKRGVIKAYGYDALNAHLRYYPTDRAR
jgi:hypothetical protein